MIHIENLRTYCGEGVYIGRPSPLGNPFKIGKHGTRNDVIAAYRVWLWKQIHARNDVYRELLRLVELSRVGDLTLICWCKEPNQEIACHGDVVRAAILNSSAWLKF